MSDADTLRDRPAGYAAPNAGAPETDSPDIEARARRMGWRPQEEFKGDASKWRPAAEFLRRGEEELPILRDRLRKLDESNARYERDLGSVRQKLDETTQVLTEFRDFAAKGEERAFEKAKAELEAKRDAAVAHADVETFREAQAAIEKLEKPKVAEAPQPAAEPTIPEAVMKFVADNPWFRHDPELTFAAKAREVWLIENHKEMSLEERLGDVKTFIKRAFSHKFENERRDMPAAVTDGGGNPVPKSNGRSYNDLPKDARDACDRFVKTIPGYKREDYLKQYQWD